MLQPPPPGGLGSRLAPLGEGEQPGLEGGGAGQGARRAGSPPRLQRTPGRTDSAPGTERSWEGAFLLPTQGSSSLCRRRPRLAASLRGSVPALPPLGRRWQLGAPAGTEGGESRSSPRLSPRGPDRGAPPPAPRAGGRALAGRRGAAPQTAHSPCPMSLPGARERAATSAGRPPRSGGEAPRHRSERGSEPERETGRGWTGTEWELPSPGALGALGASWERRMESGVFPFPPLGRRLGKRGAPWADR